MIDPSKLYAFRQHEKHRESLRQFVESDTGKLMLQVLRDALRSRTAPKTDPLIPYADILAYQYKCELGASDVLDSIESMTLPLPRLEQANPHEDILRQGASELEKAKRAQAAILARISKAAQ